MTNNRVIYVIPFEQACSIDINKIVDETVASGNNTITFKLFHSATGAQLLPYNEFHHTLTDLTIIQETLLHYQCWHSALNNKDVDILFALDIAIEHLDTVKPFAKKIPLMVDVLIDVANPAIDIEWIDDLRIDINFLVRRFHTHYLVEWQAKLQNTNFNQDIYFLDNNYFGNTFLSNIWNIFITHAPKHTYNDYVGLNDITLNAVIERKKHILPYIFMISNHMFIPIDFGIIRYHEHWNGLHQFEHIKNAIEYKKQIETQKLFKYILKNMPCKLCHHQNICVATQVWAKTDDDCSKKIFWDNII